jgi:uncharacterized BrkB/YihY/UPF0761 family membrane protein
MYYLKMAEWSRNMWCYVIYYNNRIIHIYPILIVIVLFKYLLRRSKTRWKGLFLGILNSLKIRR